MSEKSIVVYSKPHCGGCDRVKAWLSQKGIAYEVKDISQDNDALNYLISKGFVSVPVTKIGDEHVVGFDPEKLQQLIGN